MIKAIVTDIEGTTTSLSFVKDVLFPYARQHMAEYLRENAEQPEVKAQLDNVRRIIGINTDLETIIQQLIQWIDEDQKITPLKNLQGMIWQAGYKSGDFTGHVYEDAARKLRDWHEQGIKLYVFSSGSVKAQQLIFGFSDFGDMTALFSGYFDTKIGFKHGVKAYQHIVTQLDCQADEILFLSDIGQELQSAAASGMQTAQLVREEQSAYPDTIQVSNFDQIQIN